MTRLQPVFLLLGPEEGEKNEFISKIISKIKAETATDPEVVRFYAFDAKIVDTVALLRNGSLFAKHKLVVLSNVEALKRKDEFASITGYIEKPSHDATLLLLSDGVAEVDKRLKAKVPKNATKVFWELFENQKVGWIKRFFRDRELDIEPAALEFVLEMVENNTSALRQICERLAAFFGKGVVIRQHDIEQYIFHSKEENVFTLFGRISQRDFNSALETLNTIFLSGEADPIQTLSGILWQVRKLQSLKRLIDDNYQPSEAFGRMGMTSKRMQKVYIAAHKNFRGDEVEAILRLVYEFDLRLRSHRSDFQRLLLELFLYYVVVRGGRGYWKQAQTRLQSS